MFHYCKYFFYSKSYDDLTSQNSELTLRLRQKTVDFTTLSESSKSISNQLEMSQILVQQVFTNYPFIYYISVNFKSKFIKKHIS